MARGLDEQARARGGRESFAAASDERQRAIVLPTSRRPSCTAARGTRSTSSAPSVVVMRYVVRGLLRAPVGLERDRLRRPGLPARLLALRQPASPARRARAVGGARGLRARPGRRAPGAAAAMSSHADSAPPAAAMRLGSLVKGALRMPQDNDSPFLLDQHRRGLQNLDRMARYPRSEAVDLVVVGAGRRRRHACPAAGARRLADRHPREGTVLGSRPRLGLGREGLGQDLLDRHPRHRRRRPGRDGQEQLGRRGRRLDDPLRRLRRRACIRPTSRSARATASPSTGRSPTRT